MNSNQLIHYASKGNLDMVKSIVQQGIEIDNEYFLAIYDSVGNDHLDVVKFLMENNTKTKAADYDDNTYGYIDYNYYCALYICATRGNLNIAKYIVSFGTLNGFDISQILSTSAMYGHLELVKYFIEHGSNDSENYYWSIRNSLFEKHLDVAKYLIDNIHVVKITIFNEYNKYIKYTLDLVNNANDPVICKQTIVRLKKEISEDIRDTARLAVICNDIHRLATGRTIRQFT